MLWFFHAGDAKYDPIYGVYRRDLLTRTHFPYPSERTDWLLCAELALLGPIIHLDRAACKPYSLLPPTASIELHSGVASTLSAQSN